MHGVVIGLMLAAAAAVGFGSGTFVQHLSAVAVEHPNDRHRTEAGLIALLGRLVKEPRWLLGQVLTGSGSALQFIAMAFAPVAIVQPVIATGLPVAVGLEIIRERRMPSARLIAGMAMCVVGLVLFVLFARAQGEVHPPGAIAAVVLLGLAVASAIGARLAASGQLGALVSGACAGGCLGVAAVCAALPVHRFQELGLAGMLVHWSPYVAVAAGVLAIAASQQAFARGELAWSLPALTVANTFVATAMSVLLVHERLDAAATPLWATGAVIAVVGVVTTSVLHARRPPRPRPPRPSAEAVVHRRPSQVGSPPIP